MQIVGRLWVPLTSIVQSIEGRLLKKLEPQSERAHGELLPEGPVVARQILGSVLGVKIPQRTIDDLVTETIAGDPVLRRGPASGHKSVTAAVSWTPSRRAWNL